MLQDIGLIFHPPLLYMGYVGFSVAFAFSIASLMSGNLDTGLGKMVKTLDISGLVFPDIGNCVGILVGLL